MKETHANLKEKLQELDRVTGYLNSIVTHMSQGLIFVDAEGVVTTYNPMAETLLNIRQSQVLFHQFSKTFPDNLFGFSMAKALRTAEAPKRTYVTLSATDDEHLDRDLEIETSFLLKDHSKHSLSSPIDTGIILLLRDITEIKHLQAIANRADRMKELGEMAAAVAHEIRNPLGGIKGFATLLERDLKDSPKLKEIASHIISGTDHLNSLVGLLEYARPITLEMESADLIALLDEIVQYVQVDDTLHKSTTIELIAPSTPVLSCVDQQLLKSAFLNLLKNAAESIPEKGGHIEVSISEEKRRIIICIKDTGVGIPAKNLDRLFKPFFTTKPHGHGFGLPEVHRIVHEHHGDIFVHSTEGKGTTFTVVLKKNSG